MDTTLTVNPGSSSKKYALFRNGREVLSVLFERTGDGYGKCVEINNERQLCEDITATAYDASIPEVLRIALGVGAITQVHDITCIALRIVAPGSFFTQHRVVDADYRRRIEEVAQVAPLHIPATLDELRAVQEALPHAKVVGCSDSAFHRTVPPYARTYSIPEADSQEFDVYRFGYHGLSVSSALAQVREAVGDLPSRVIVCHVGSGVSVTAVKDGESIDTSMGFAPGSGLMMGTRAGDIDPGALLYVLDQKGLTGIDAERYVNTACGLKGVLGNGDLRVALDRMARGEAKASNAVHMYMYRIQKMIGGYIAALGGLDMLVLTATAAERNPTVRALIAERLAPFGVKLDGEANEALMGRPGVVSSIESAVVVRVVCTDEMHEMARIADGF